MSEPSEPLLSEERLERALVNASGGEFFDIIYNLIREVRRLRRVTSKIAWHRDGIGPDVPVLQERYDTLRSENERLRRAVEAARAEERERIAKLVERWNLGTLAAAIRHGFKVDEDAADE